MSSLLFLLGKTCLVLVDAAAAAAAAAALDQLLNQKRSICLCVCAVWVGWLVVVGVVIVVPVVDVVLEL